ncbi:PIG-L deacetylase family protein [Pendulispora albinea]|uniref:PIG-L family deacetylase n=1 Tax=Pendulispora albinea TaxID=2741071 RepID=A0ABZ2M6H2_9BACT
MIEGKLRRYGLGLFAGALMVGVLVVKGGTALSLPSSPPASASGAGTPVELAPVDVVIFAPHPDDETIGCAGVIQQAVAAGKKVRIVFSTLGDGYSLAAGMLLHKDESTLAQADFLALGRARQQEAIDANRTLGVNPANLVFLGYPDGAFDRVAANTDGKPVVSPTTGRSSTYGPVVPDYHASAHGQPASYTRAEALADLTEVLRQSHPSQVYVTDRNDAHPDHKATYELVKAAVEASGYKGAFFTFVVHSGPPLDWPWPQGATPQAPFQQHTANGHTYPLGVPWPPNVRVPMTVAESVLKANALAAHRSQWNLPSDRGLLGAFVKSEEIFWTGR